MLEHYTKNIAIVGARKSNFYADDVIKDLVPELIKNDFSIVSGGALGVDSRAHEQTLKSGGKTIAVFGSGLLNPYPLKNKDLFREIVKSGGTLVSPFPLLMEPRKGNFPARNRVIAGLSKGCIVVQAAKKSGALITAQFALEQGRHVFAIPGSIKDELSVGCHEIIKQGAKLVGGIDDILEEFGFVPYNAAEEILKGVKDAKRVDEEVECILYNLQSACSIDELSVKTKLDLVFLQDKLFELQIAGKVEQNITGMWERI
jgi:DNA processing protein